VVSEKVDLLLRVLHQAEGKVAGDLVAIGERHKADHEVYHLTRDLAAWSREHARLIADLAAGRGMHLHVAEGGPSPLSTVREKISEFTGGRPEPGLVLLRDLRRIHLDCVGLSVDWELLAQTAQSLKDDELLALAQRCHPDALRQARWANSMIKIMSPQIMAG
jgi:hypothetical protein